MTARNSRAPSSTSNSGRSAGVPRPNSSASTTSGMSNIQHDFATQFHRTASQPTPPLHHMSQQQYAPHPQQQYALFQAAQQGSQQEHIPMDPVHQLAGYVGDAQNNMPLQHIDPNAQPPFPQQHQQQQYLADQQQRPAYPVETEEKKKKGSGGGNAQNDKELREMLRQNSGRRLDQIAAEVIASDRTSRSEKSKQLFAMLWLEQACRTGTKSVPRNKVFSAYAERCATERVIPLNPASFGKLVRVIFPKIQTRRLGVRGESKYHYVDLYLVDDDDNDAARRPSSSHPRNSLPPPIQRHDSSGPPRSEYDSLSRLPVDTAAFPPQSQPSDARNGYFPQNSSRGRVFANIFTPEFHSPTSRTAPTYEYELRFPTPDLLGSVETDHLKIVMPAIHPYLPPGSDPDATASLVALYRSHITSLVDAVRFCKEKQFFRLFTSFHGTLTTPVQKLFTMPELSTWIRECDWMMYQKMIRNVAQLTLQVAPAPVLKFLDNVSKNLHSHLSRVFQNQPSHVLEAKLQPATIFAHLLRQMLRVNSTAHAAAVLLTVDDNRDRMWADWQAYVVPKRILENELPESCAHEEVYKILTTEIRTILQPAKCDPWLPDAYQQPSLEPLMDPLQETVIDRIAAFLTRLPARFPSLSARTILHTVNAIGSAAMREITVENGTSFQGWWLTKVFIDEMAQWLASLGGFLSHHIELPNESNYSPNLLGESVNAALTSGSNGSQNHSRLGSEDFGADTSFMSTTGPDMTGSHQQNQHQIATVSTEFSFLEDIDDSGIHLDDDAKLHQLQQFHPHVNQMSAGAP